MVDIAWPGPGGTYRIHLHEDVYRPGEDTLLLAQAVWQYARRGARFLEIGCGSGAVSLVAARSGMKTHATDVNPLAVQFASRNASGNGLSVDVRQGDLFADHVGPFDVVAFNPPYLPTKPEERIPGPINLAFDGGLDGNETVLRFAGALAHRDLPGLILVVHSSLADPAPLDDALARLGYHVTVDRQHATAYETITVRRYKAAEAVA